MPKLGWNYDPSKYKKDAPTTEYVLIPEGLHQVRIIKVEVMQAKSGKEMLAIRMVPLDYQEKTALTYFLVKDYENSDRTNQNVGRMFDCFDMMNWSSDARDDTDHWLGCWGGVEIIHKEREGKDGRKRLFAEIKRLLTQEEQIKAGSNITISKEDLEIPI